MPPSLTLDTNCLIELERNRESAPALRRLVKFHEEGLCNVALIGASASERMRGGGLAPAYSKFLSFVAQLDLCHLEVLAPIGIWGVTYWGHCLWASDESETEVDVLFRALFPFFDPKPPERSGEHWGKWLNRMCDALMVWTHRHNDRDIFVTLDQNFHKKAERLNALGITRIRTPDSALESTGIK